MTHAAKAMKLAKKLSKGLDKKSKAKAVSKWATHVKALLQGGK